MRLQLLLIIFWRTIVDIYSYTVPAVVVEPLENGFRVWIPDEQGIKNVAFNVNRYLNFTGLEQGEFSSQVFEPENGRWQHDFKGVKLRRQDPIYIWTNVQHENAIYYGFSQRFCQQTESKHNFQSDCKISSSQISEESTANSGAEKKVLASTLSFCEIQSETVIEPPSDKPLCKGQLIFEDDFKRLNESFWQYDVRAPLDSSDAEFVLYDGVARVSSGQLIIEPKLWSNYRPDIQIIHGQLDLSDRCTGVHNKEKECILTARGPFIMPPVVVPRLTTKESFSFKYGRIEIRAKFPKGDWLIPLLLLEPLMGTYGQTGYESGQLRVAMARGNDQLRLQNGKLIDGRTLYAGAVLTTEASQREDFMVQQKRSAHFGDDFHVYGVRWSSGSLRFSIDGEEYGELLSGFTGLDINPSWRRGGPMAPFDKMFYISLGLSVGGFGDFVDKSRTSSYEKPWINKHPDAKLKFWQSQDRWLPTWKQPNLYIDYIRVYAI